MIVSFFTSFGLNILICPNSSLALIILSLKPNQQAKIKTCPNLWYTRQFSSQTTLEWAHKLSIYVS